MRPIEEIRFIRDRVLADIKANPCPPELLLTQTDEERSQINAGQRRRAKQRRRAEPRRRYRTRPEPLP